MKNVEKWIIVILSVIAVAAIGTAVYFGINAQDNKTEFKEEQVNNKSENEQNKLQENVENNEQDTLDENEDDEEENEADLDTILQNTITNEQVLEKYKKITWAGDIEFDNCNSIDIYTENFELSDKFKQCISVNTTEVKTIDNSSRTMLNEIFKGYDGVEFAEGYFTIDEFYDNLYLLFNDKKPVVEKYLSGYTAQCPTIMFKDGMFLVNSECGGFFGVSVEKFNIKYEEINNKFYVYETVGFSDFDNIYVDFPSNKNVQSFNYDSNFDINKHPEFHTYKYIFEKNSDDVIYLSSIERVK